MSPCRAWLGNPWGHLEQDVGQRSLCTAQDSNGGLAKGVCRARFRGHCSKESQTSAQKRHATVLSKFKKRLHVAGKGPDSRAGGALSGSYAKPTALSHVPRMSELLCALKKVDDASGILYLWVRKRPYVPITGHPSTESRKDESPEHGTAGPVKTDCTSLNV